MFIAFAVEFKCVIFQDDLYKICAGSCCIFWFSSFRNASWQALIPSLCGVFVYRDVTSMVTSKELTGMFKFSISIINREESLRNDFKVLTCGCSQKSMNWLMFSVGLWQKDTIGLIPIGFLWIFFKNVSVLV